MARLVREMERASHQLGRAKLPTDLIRSLYPRHVTRYIVR